jgi:hypothetical protein
MKYVTSSLLLLLACSGIAQIDTLSVDTLPEEDFSMYETFDFADEGAKRFCTPKVFDLSPAKLISLGWDQQGAFDLDSDTLNDGFSRWMPGTTGFSGAGGIRAAMNVPIVSKNSIVLQGGFNYWRIGYQGASNADVNPLATALKENGLTTLGLMATVFKPLDERRFFIFSGNADINGDFYFQNITPLKYTRYSAALLYGVKQNDRKMIAFGLSRTYRVGEINYIPVMLLNWTHPGRKWGVEMLAPARAQIRRSITPRHLLFFGYELEGNTYRVMANGTPALEHFELRRSELRFRFIWEQSIYKFIWLSVQAGYRYDYSYNVDEFANDREFFRGFFGDQPYAMENSLTGTWYTFISLNLVSP